MTTASLLIVYCTLIVTASVMGGLLPSKVKMTHLRTQLLMSFVSGLMLGIAMLHMLPHATELLGSPSATGYAALIGIIAMFLLLRAFHVHGHGHAEDDHACEHEHHHECSDHQHGKRDLGWSGMLFGLGLHTLMDGVALAASVTAEAFHGPWLGLAGLGTFLAVALHKPLDAFAITSVMAKKGWTTSQQSFVNVLFSLACPIGALLFYFGASQFSSQQAILGWGLAISGGFFICISLSDLLPEVAFHDHDRVRLTGALLLGVVLAVAIENLPGHSHDHQHDPPSSDNSTPAISATLDDFPTANHAIQ